MGNIFHLCLLNNPCASFSKPKNRKVLLVLKMDGKNLEFKSPVIVRDLLVNFNGFGVKSSKKSSKYLPSGFELKLGHCYYLLPLLASDQSKKSLAPSVSVPELETEPDVGIKRIKVVITKQQLQDLLAKKISVEKVLSGIDNSCCVDSWTDWKPSLTSIPEENEMQNV